MMEAKSPDAPALPPMPGFDDFYRAINGRDPFPWQTRLAGEVAETEEWRAEIGVPTGLGKTACLDIAVWWLASQADRLPANRTAPTRIWWLVNRRLLVDAVTDHAETISKALGDPSSLRIGDQAAAVVTGVADRLRSLSADPGAAPLEVIRLRGGVQSRRPTDPSTPAVLLSTLPMYGSRLLFRGYGSSRSMRPIDAAMAGTDSLVLLDEAHLAPHLRSLISALADCTPGAQAVLGESRSRPKVAALTATGNPGETSRFDLDADDEAHPVVRQRLDAVKPMEVCTFDRGDIGQLLAEAALSLMGEASAPAACLVFANTPAIARATFQLLRKEESAEVLLLTGRSREREAERIRGRVLDPVDGMAAVRDASLSRRRHLIVVATQTLEVGADVDAEYLVTEACGVRALTQRLGRLNRLGRHAHARAIYLHLPPKTQNRGKTAGGWPVYGEEPMTVLDRLQDALPKSFSDVVNLSPRHIAAALGAPMDDPGRAPEILPGILWEWVKTTTPPEGEAPVEPYFSGIAGPDYSVSLIWRAHVPDSGELLWPRPSDREAVEVPISEAREALDEEEDLRRLGPDGVTMEGTTREDLRPGDTLVLPCDRGLMDEFGWDPSSSSPVVDISILEHGLPLNSRALLRLCGLSLGALVNTALGISEDDEEIDEAERDEALERILADLTEVTPQGWEEAEWQDLLAGLDRQILTARKEVPRLARRSGGSGILTLSDELDEVSLTDTAVLLDRHGQAVAARARQIADRLGLSADLAEVLERGGGVHDIGKADPRFQRWLDPDEEHAGVKVAKSNMPRHLWNGARAVAGWPAGGRHEELSGRLARRWLELHPTSCEAPLHDLLLHLIISHHGSGRPLLPPVEDATSTVLAEAVEGALVEAPADLALVDWDQPARFRSLCDRFGPGGLALLEAILRQSDHAVSAGADVGLEVH